MRKKLWLGVIVLAILGSQFWIAFAVTEWRGDVGPPGPRGEQGLQGTSAPSLSQAESDLRKCEAAV